MALQPWLEWAQWAVVGNPFRGSEPIGWGLERNGELSGVVLYVWVPARILAWRGVSPMPFCLAAGGVPLGGIRLLKPFLEVPSLLPHAIDFGVKLLTRSGGAAVLGSEVSLSSCLSRYRRLRRYVVRRWLGRPGFSVDVCAMGTVMSAIPSGQVTRLAERCAAEAGACVVKTSEYLVWRYAREEGRFRAIALRDSEEIVGLSVLESLPNGDCRIMEFLSDPAVPDAADRLLSKTVIAAVSAGHVMAFARVGEMRLLPVWQRHGFRAHVKPNRQFWANLASVTLADTIPGQYSHGDHSFS